LRNWRGSEAESVPTVVPTPLFSAALLFDVRRRTKREKSQLRRKLALESLEDRRLLSATPQLLKDIFPTAGSSNPANLVAMSNVLYFTAGDDTHGNELWKSDDTPAGTALVKDIQPGTGSSFPSHLLPVGNLLYFWADDGVNGMELWKSDGTEAAQRTDPHIFLCHVG
jgi:ELWxxDGT repeat protein